MLSLRPADVQLRQQIQQSDRIVGVDGFEGVGAALMDKATCRRCSGVLNLGAMNDEGPKCGSRGNIEGLGLEARLQHASSLPVFSLTGCSLADHRLDSAVLQPQPHSRRRAQIGLHTQARRAKGPNRSRGCRAPRWKQPEVMCNISDQQQIAFVSFVVCKLLPQKNGHRCFWSVHVYVSAKEPCRQCSNLQWLCTGNFYLAHKAH